MTDKNSDASKVKNPLLFILLLPASFTLGMFYSDTFNADKDSPFAPGTIRANCEAELMTVQASRDKKSGELIRLATVPSGNSHYYCIQRGTLPIEIFHQAPAVQVEAKEGQK